METNKLKTITLHPIDNGWVVQTVEGNFFPRTVYFESSAGALAEACKMVAAQTKKDERGQIFEIAANLEKLNG